MMNKRTNKPIKRRGIKFKIAINTTRMIVPDIPSKSSEGIFLTISDVGVEKNFSLFNSISLAVNGASVTSLLIAEMMLDTASLYLFFH